MTRLALSGLALVTMMQSQPFAQTPSLAPPDAVSEVYSPRPTHAAVPMRVEVVSSTGFIDVETRRAYRLYGIDACDARQTATLGKQSWPCGIVATAWLVGATLNRWVACTTIRQQDEIRIGRCATGEISDLAAEMLKAGHALTLPGSDDRLIASYAQHEKDARTAYRGLWGSSFQMPWVFRQQHSQGAER